VELRKQDFGTDGRTEKSECPPTLVWRRGYTTRNNECLYCNGISL